jgi:hypothetical protein
MRLCAALPVMLLIVSMQSSLLAQTSDCTGKAAQAQLSSIDPVYVDAMDLARNLVDHGFIVKCVQASKWGNLFIDLKQRLSMAFKLSSKGRVICISIRFGEPRTHLDVWRAKRLTS